MVMIRQPNARLNKLLAMLSKIRYKNEAEKGAGEKMVV